MEHQGGNPLYGQMCSVVQGQEHLAVPGLAISGSKTSGGFWLYCVIVQNQSQCN